MTRGCVSNLCCVLAFSVVPAANAQILLDSVDNMDFDRPESWAMKYFTSVSIMDGFGDPGVGRGEITVGFEAGWVPSLSEEERRVGFIGSKVEDLNRTSAFGRIRATFGLPSNWDLTFGVVPPLEIDGVTPELLNVAISRPVVSRRNWNIRARLHAQIGTLGGDLTCPANIVGVADETVNPDDCLEPSDDEVTMDHAGLAWTYSRTAGERWRPFVTASANYFDLKFQVRARYSEFIDREVLLTDGWTYHLALGSRYHVGEKVGLVGEVFYTPLDVVRSAATGSQIDELLNFRVLFDYRVR